MKTTSKSFASRQRRLNYRWRLMMANTYTSLFYHVVFSTKNRVPYIKPGIENRVWAYVGGVARKHKMTALQIGGMEDHIHALIIAPPILSPSQIAQYLKGDTSKWMKEEFPMPGQFAWQDGYGAFTVSKSTVPDVIDYIKTQRDHHRRMSFQDEYQALLRKHGIEYDERYLLG